MAIQYPCFRSDECTLFDFQVNAFDIEGHLNPENDQIQRAEDAGEIHLQFQIEYLETNYIFGDDPIQEGRLCKA